MGAASSCCSVEPSKQKDLIRHDATPTDQHHATQPESRQPTPAELEQFRTNLNEGIDTIVVIADGKKIPCRLKWSASEQNLIISCDVNNHMHIRRMALNELLAVIHDRKDLARVATRANIVEDPACVALHLASNTCIPLSFHKIEEKICFVEFMRQIKSQAAPQSISTSNQTTGGNGNTAGLSSSSSSSDQTSKNQPAPLPSS